MNMSGFRPVHRGEVARFRRDGFVVVDRPVVPARALRPVRELLDGLFQRAHELPAPWVHDLAPDARTGCVPEIVNAAHVEPRLLRTRAYRLAVRAARRLLGTPVELTFDHAIFKPPGSGADTALHQDLAFEPDWDVPTATIWLALVDATCANGCMRFLPETPKELLDHEPVGRDALGVVGLDVSQAPPHPVPAGGFTVHSQRAVHGSGRNESTDVRAVWILKFVKDERSWRRRTWERSLELQGVVVPRRFAELREAAGNRDRPARPPDWVDGAPGVVQKAGMQNVLPSGDDRAYR
jgi:hypothetical protein